MVEGRLGTLVPFHNPVLLNWVGQLTHEGAMYLVDTICGRKSQIKQNGSSFGRCASYAALAIVAADRGQVDAFARVMVASGKEIVPEIKNIFHGYAFCHPIFIAATLVRSAQEMMNPASTQPGGELMASSVDLVAYAIHSHYAQQSVGKAAQEVFEQVGNEVLRLPATQSQHAARELGYRVGIFAAGLLQYADDIHRKDARKKHIAELGVKAVALGLASAAPAMPLALAFIAPTVNFIGSAAVDFFFRERDFQKADRQCRWAIFASI